jgi:copper homeostasis protein (lipoprotein)
MRKLAGLTAVLGVMAGAAAAQEAEDFQPLHGLDLPASFTGTLPCADCPGIAMQIDLWPDQSFLQSWTYLERDLTVADMGRWVPDPVTGALILRGQGDGVQMFAPQGVDRLVMRDRDGQPIQSEMRYDLTAKGFAPLSLDLTLTGEVRYMADAAMFTECISQRSYPVAFEDAWIDAERLYLDARAEPGAPLLMTMAVRIAPRPPMEGDGTVMTVIPQAVGGAFPGEACAQERAPARLTGTYWRVETLGGAPLTPQRDSREPFIVLRAGEDRFHATVGCNQMGGGFTAAEDGTGLRFQPGPRTMMACAPPLDSWENALIAALADTQSHEIAGNTLLLRDAEGETVAVLRAVYLY